MVFDDTSGRAIDLDLRGTDQEIIERLSQSPQVYGGHFRPSPVALDEKAPEARGRGRPKLGVISREVTLLPRQWEWLAAQSGGASAMLRRLIDEARRNGDTAQKSRNRQERTYNFMLAMAGNLPGYEEATRALFAGDAAGLAERVADWPGDIRTHVLYLAFGDEGAGE